MLIRQIEEKHYDEFKKLFISYYEELDCEDDPCHLFDEYVLPDLKENLISVAVVLMGEAVEGFVIYQIDTPENEWCFKEGYGDIREIYVTPSARGINAGKMLLEFAEFKIEQQGIKKAYVLPTEETEGFFTHCGYSDNGEYCAELDNKVFEKTLNF